MTALGVGLAFIGGSFLMNAALLVTIRRIFRRRRVL